MLGTINPPPPPLAESHTVKQGAVIFIKVLKMIIGSIIFLTIVSGIAWLHSLKEFGSIGLKAFIYFEVVSTLALAIGIIVPKILQPGSGMNLKMENLYTKGVDKFITQSKILP